MVKVVFISCLSIICLVPGFATKPFADTWAVWRSVPFSDILKPVLFCAQSKHYVAPCAKVNMQCLWDMRTSNFISVLKSVGLIIWQALILHTTLDLLHQCKKKTSPTSMDCCNVRRVSLTNTEGFSLTSIFFCSAHFPRGMFCDQDDLLSFYFFPQEPSQTCCWYKKGVTGQNLTSPSWHWHHGLG